MNNWCICWFFSSIFLLGILIFKGFTARRLYKSFGVESLTTSGSVSLHSTALFRLEGSKAELKSTRYFLKFHVGFFFLNSCHITGLKRLEGGSRTQLQAREFRWGWGVNKWCDVNCSDVEWTDVIYVKLNLSEVKWMKWRKLKWSSWG
jgi:hypothetical protein